MPSPVQCSALLAGVVTGRATWPPGRMENATGCLDAALEALKKFGAHSASCDGHNGWARKCDCGFDNALAAVETVLKENQ